MNNENSFSWVSSSRSDVGNKRQINEDACLELPGRGLWVVADGMGGHAAGDVASQMLVSMLQGIDSHDKLSEFVDDVEDRVLEVNRRLHEMSFQDDERKVIGSTLAALLAFGNHVVSMWVGDSRVYRLREGELLKQVTTGQSEVEELIAEFGLERVRRSKGFMLSGGERRRTEIARALRAGALTGGVPPGGHPAIEAAGAERVSPEPERGTPGPPNHA